MKFIGDPADFMGTLGPPTAFQPQWAGVGYKSYLFESSPVGHVVTPDSAHHQLVNVRPEDAHLPVERTLLGYIRETGYDPGEFDAPAYRAPWENFSEQFGFPDSRPVSAGQRLPEQAQPPRHNTRMPDLRGNGRIRDASEASLPRKPRGF